MDLLIVVALYSLLIYILNLILKLPVEYSPIVERGLSLKITPYVEDNFLVIVLLYSLSKLLVLYPYFVLMESSRLQGTIGKLILGLKVTDTFGRRISFGRASGRFFGKLLSGQILLIGYLMAALTAKKQALHDVLARTLVINKVAAFCLQPRSRTSHSSGRRVSVLHRGLAWIRGCVRRRSTSALSGYRE